MDIIPPSSKNFRFYDGRPSESGCSPEEVKTYDFLDQLSLDYKTLKHPAAYTIEECNRVREIVHAPVFKNLFLTNKQQTAFYLLVMPGEKIFKTKYLSAQIGSARLSFANEDHMLRYLGLRPGSVSPLGLINDNERVVRLLLDRDLCRHEIFACHPCINTASVILTLKDLIDTIIPAMNHDFQWVTLPEE